MSTFKGTSKTTSREFITKEDLNQNSSCQETLQTAQERALQPEITAKQRRRCHFIHRIYNSRIIQLFARAMKIQPRPSCKKDKKKPSCDDDTHKFSDCQQVLACQCKEIPKLSTLDIVVTETLKPELLQTYQLHDIPVSQAVIEMSQESLEEYLKEGEETEEDPIVTNTIALNNKHAIINNTHSLGYKINDLNHFNEPMKLALGSPVTHLYQIPELKIQECPFQFNKLLQEIEIDEDGNKSNNLCYTPHRETKAYLGMQQKCTLEFDASYEQSENVIDPEQLSSQKQEYEEKNLVNDSAKKLISDLFSIKEVNNIDELLKYKNSLINTDSEMTVTQKYLDQHFTVDDSEDELQGNVECLYQCHLDGMSDINQEFFLESCKFNIEVDDDNKLDLNHNLNLNVIKEKPQISSRMSCLNNSMRYELYDLPCGSSYSSQERQRSIKHQPVCNLFENSDSGRNKISTDKIIFQVDSEIINETSQKGSKTKINEEEKDFHMSESKCQLVKNVDHCDSETQSRNDSMSFQCDNEIVNLPAYQETNMLERSCNNYPTKNLKYRENGLALTTSSEIEGQSLDINHRLTNHKLFKSEGIWDIFIKNDTLNSYPAKSDASSFTHLKYETPLLSQPLLKILSRFLESPKTLEFSKSQLGLTLSDVLSQMCHFSVDYGGDLSTNSLNERKSSLSCKLYGLPVLIEDKIIDGEQHKQEVSLPGDVMSSSSLSVLQVPNVIGNMSFDAEAYNEKKQSEVLEILMKCKANDTCETSSLDEFLNHSKLDTCVNLESAQECQPINKNKNVERALLCQNKNSENVNNKLLNVAAQISDEFLRSNEFSAETVQHAVKPSDESLKPFEYVLQIVESTLIPINDVLEMPEVILESFRSFLPTDEHLINSANSCEFESVTNIPNYNKMEHNADITYSNTNRVIECMKEVLEMLDDVLDLITMTLIRENRMNHSKTQIDHLQTNSNMFESVSTFEISEEVDALLASAFSNHSDAILEQNRTFSNVNSHESMSVISFESFNSPPESNEIMRNYMSNYDTRNIIHTCNETLYMDKWFFQQYPNVILRNIENNNVSSISTSSNEGLHSNVLSDTLETTFLVIGLEDINISDLPTSVDINEDSYSTEIDITTYGNHDEISTATAEVLDQSACQDSEISGEYENGTDSDLKSSPELNKLDSGDTEMNMSDDTQCI